MTSQNPSFETIQLEKIYLDSENPRHEVLDTQDEQIAFLCKEEKVGNLALDIAENGINPMMRIAVLEEKPDKNDQSAKSTYIVLDGNRRICSLKMLEDPELAPSKLKKKMEEASCKWTPITEIECVVFDDRKIANMWLKRIHTGERDGTGLKSWDAEQQARFDDESKNKLALLLLDYAQGKGFISSPDRKRTITTVQRVLDNEKARNLIGLDNSSDKVIKTFLPTDKFEDVVKSFMESVADKEVFNSRNLRKAADIEEFAKNVTKSVMAEDYNEDSNQIYPKPNLKNKSKSKEAEDKSGANIKPPKSTKIRVEQEIVAELNKLSNDKLTSLYNSITKLQVKDHTPLITVGVWSMVESLTSIHGRKDKNSFESYLNKSLLQKMGVEGESSKNIRDAIGRISSNGNMVKHDSVGTNFYGDQLINDMTQIRPVIVALLQAAVAKMLKSL